MPISRFTKDYSRFYCDLDTLLRSYSTTDSGNVNDLGQ
jgi:hypothetical protein